MLEQCSLSLLSGGYYDCSPAWDKVSDAFDRCFKFWLPTEGLAYVVIDGEQREIRPGAVYFISGYRQERHRCPNHMGVYWVHFRPADLYMAYLLSRAPRFYHWPESSAGMWRSTFQQVPRLFLDSQERMYPPAPDRSPGLTWRFEAMLLYFVADLVEFDEAGARGWPAHTYRELKPAIDFMDRNFRRNPSLADTAARAFMSPGTFHRKFAQAFHVTPHAYMAEKRLNLANQLLASTDLSVKEVAEQVGYDNPYYFSRAFKKHFGMSPARLRAAEGRAQF